MLLLDTDKRLHHSSLFGLTPGINRVVFLDEVSVNGLTIKDTKKLKEKVYSMMEDKLKTPPFKSGVNFTIQILILKGFRCFYSLFLTS